MKSNLTNEIKRVRNKLKIFEMEGSGQLMSDLLSLVGTKVHHASVISGLKAKLNKELEDLLSKQLKYKQSKLNL
jgi:hypothetical protein